MCGIFKFIYHFNLSASFWWLALHSIHCAVSPSISEIACLHLNIIAVFELVKVTATILLCVVATYLPAWVAAACII